MRALGEAQWDLLRAAPGFRRLFLATLSSSVGTYLAVVALTVDVYDESGGDANWVSALLIADFLPVIVVGLAFAPLVDRLPRRGILVVSDLIRAAVFAVLPLADRPGSIVGLALVAGAATSFFRPAVYSGIPNLVTDGRLPAANSLVQSAENLTWAVGGLIGGALVNLGGIELAYWLNACTFVVSALLLLGIRESFEETVEDRPPYLAAVREGLGVVGRSRVLVTILVAWSIVTFGGAVASVAEIFVARDVFAQGSFGFGVLVATAAFGLFVGSLTGGAVIEQTGIRTAYVASLAVIAIGFAVAAASPSFWLAAAVVAVAGCGNGVAVVCNTLLVQRAVPDWIRGRAFTLVMSVGYAALGAGMIVAGPLTNAFGGRASWATAAALSSIGAVCAAALLASPAALRPEAPPA